MRTELNNPNYHFPYECTITNGSELGLPFNYGVLKYMPYTDFSTGLGVQIAVSSYGPQYLCYRRGNGTVFENWKKFSILEDTIRHSTFPFINLNDGIDGDFNDITEFGVYNFRNDKSCKNTPDGDISTVSHYGVIVFGHDIYYIIQIAISLYEPYKRYIRNKQGDWKPWKEF